MGIFRGALGIVAAIALVIALGFGLFWFSTETSMRTADRRGEVEKMEQVEANGARRIADYEWFHNTCQDIVAQNQNIELAEQTLKGDKKTETLYALNATHNDTVADYNSRASQDYTSGQFKDSDLPYEIDPEDRDVDCG